MVISSSLWQQRTDANIVGTYTSLLITGFFVDLLGFFLLLTGAAVVVVVVSSSSSSYSTTCSVVVDVVSCLALPLPFELFELFFVVVSQLGSTVVVSVLPVLLSRESFDCLGLPSPDFLEPPTSLSPASSYSSSSKTVGESAKLSLAFVSSGADVEVVVVEVDVEVVVVVVLGGNFASCRLGFARPEVTALLARPARI